MAGLDAAPLPEVEFVFEGPGGGGWRPVHVFIKEGMSTLYEASLILANRSTDAVIDEVLEKPVSLEIRRAHITRALRGIVWRVEDLGSTGGYRFARVVVVPTLRALEQRVNSRVWQDVNVPTIIQDVLKEAGIYQGDAGLDYPGSLDELPPREYCVQYRESDLDFVRRLLEEEGVPFFFRHDGATETWCLAEDGHRWEDVPTLDDGAVQIMDAGMATHGAESVDWFDWHRELRPTGVALRDFDFTHPRAFIDFTPRHPGDGGDRPVYDYPAGFTLGVYDEDAHAYRPHHGARRARVRHEENLSPAKLGAGRSNITGFSPGRAYALQGHLRGDLDQRYLVLTVEHHGAAWGDIPDDVRNSEHVRAITRAMDESFASEPTSGGDRVTQRYWNRFVVVAADVPWRPARTVPRALVHGPQTATVMAGPGEDEEIYTDFHGRVLVGFHWDRRDLRPGGQRPMKASCWVRVAQAWAGAAWGSMFIPRVGMEVVVHFLEGDPDRPLVTGCVYNGENAVPYPLPAEKTKSTLKTSSSKGGQGFNELRIEDLADNEQIFVHAQRDYDTVVRRNQTLVVGNDRTKTVQANEMITVQKDRMANIEQNDSLEIEGNYAFAVHGGVGAALRVDTNYTLNADKSIALKVGDSQIVLTPDHITLDAKTIHVIGGSLVNINGGLVKINCGDGGTNDAVGSQQTATAAALQLQGTPGGILQKLKDAINPAELAEKVGGLVDKTLQRLGVPDRVRERITSLAKNTVTEVATALKEGRRPNFSKIAEQAITDGVGMIVDAGFKSIENNPKVKSNPLLAGAVKELKAVTKTSATYGVLVAADLREGLARDPFFSVLQARHGEAVSGLLKNVASTVATQNIQRWVDRRGLPPWAKKLADQAIRQADKAIGQQIDRLLLPGN